MATINTLPIMLRTSRAGYVLYRALVNFCNDLYLLIFDVVNYILLHNSFCLHNNSAAALMFTIHSLTQLFHLFSPFTV